MSKLKNQVDDFSREKYDKFVKKKTVSNCKIMQVTS